MKAKGNPQKGKGQVNLTNTPFFSSAKFHLVAIAGCALLLYIPSLNYELTYYDDATLVDNINDFIRQKHSFFEVFSQSVFGFSPGSPDFYYRPMLTLSFYIDAWLYGTSLTGFHFTNILIHIVASCLLYLFFRKLKFNAQLSFSASLLFTVHPALVQAVAWIPGRNDSLLTLFGLLSLVSLIRYLEKDQTLFLLLHVLCFFLSLLTKETAVLLPVLYFFCAGIISKSQLQTRSIDRKKLSQFIYILLWVSPIILFFVIRRSILGASVGLPLSFTLENLLKNTPALVQYLGKMLLPFNLSTFPILINTSFIFGIVTLACLGFLLIRSKNIRRDHLLLASTWLILFLIPALLRTASDYESVFLEHRLYFPLIGFFLLLLETDFIKNISFQGALPKAVFGIGFFLLAFLSFNHGKDYKNEFSYWSTAVATSPGASFAHKALGSYFQSRGNIEEAEKEYQKALKLNPGLKDVRNNLGRIFLNSGKYDTAEQLFNEELNINPNNAITYYNLGLIRLNQKKITEAESLIRKSLELDPNYLDAQNDLCVVLAMQQKYEEAIQLCIKILESNPDYSSAKKNVTLIFSAWKDEKKVIYYREILQQKGIQY